MQLHAVTFAYEPGAPVVQAVSAALMPGRLTALIGPNAAGKSTLLKLMLGQLTPTAGEVTLGKAAVAQMDPRRRARRISYVPQGGSVSFGFTVREVVAMGGYASGAGPEAVEQALNWCDLASVAARPFAQLSGGQQQRVVLARAVAQAQAGGEVLLADEPGSHMDLWHVHHTMQLCLALARQGLAVLVVVHDLNLAARYADDVWLMQAGRLVADGPWDHVLDAETLAGIYGVTLTDMRADSGDRPVFRVEAGPTLEMDWHRFGKGAGHEPAD
jgi:iron complex transport system ATP-binding protein